VPVGGFVPPPFIWRYIMQSVKPNRNYKMSKQDKIFLSMMQGEERSNYKKNIIDADNTKIEYTKKKKSK